MLLPEQKLLCVSIIDFVFKIIEWEMGVVTGGVILVPPQRRIICLHFFLDSPTEHTKSQK